MVNSQNCSSAFDYYGWVKKFKEESNQIHLTNRYRDLVDGGRNYENMSLSSLRQRSEEISTLRAELGNAICEIDEGWFDGARNAAGKINETIHSKNEKMAKMYKKIDSTGFGAMNLKELASKAEEIDHILNHQDIETSTSAYECKETKNKIVKYAERLQKEEKKTIANLYKDEGSKKKSIFELENERSGFQKIFASKTLSNQDDINFCRKKIFEMQNKIEIDRVERKTNGQLTLNTRRLSELC